MSTTEKLFKRLDVLLDRAEKLLPRETEISTEPGYSGSSGRLEGPL